MCVPSTLASGVQTVDKEAQQMVQKLKAKSTNMKSSSTEFFIYQQQKTTERSLRVKQPNTIVRLDEVTFCGFVRNNIIMFWIFNFQGNFLTH